MISIIIHILANNAQEQTLFKEILLLDILMAVAQRFLLNEYFQPYNLYYF